jgi:hypothetical protein
MDIWIMIEKENLKDEGVLEDPTSTFVNLTHASYLEDKLLESETEDMKASPSNIEFRVIYCL